MPKKESLQSKKEPQQERLTNDGMTLQEVADALNLSREKIATIEKMALRKLRSRIIFRYNKDDLL
jgi:DNA-directed RNA polymerase sigma subunit (sigma70/sigma32)